MSTADLIRDIFTSPLGSFGFVFGLMALAGWLIFYVTRKVTIINNNHTILNRTVDKIEISLANVGSELVFIKGTWAAMNVEEMRRELLHVRNSIDMMAAGKNKYFQSHSPVTLNEAGVKVAVELKADDLITNNWAKIFGLLEAEICDKNAYDIQQYCMDEIAIHPEKFIDDSSLKTLKDFAFRHGDPLSLYLKVIGLLIRDRYLGLKGIPIEEIDRHDPEKKSD